MVTRTKLDSSLQFGKVPAKGGKSNGVPYNSGKGSGTKGKGKCTKDSDFSPSVLSRDVLGDTAIRAGDSATRSRSVGLNEYTKNNPLQDPLQRGIREWSNSAEMGQGHNQPKGKGKGKGKSNGKRQWQEKNIQERETATRTRLDLRMKKLGSARWVILV